MSLKRVTASGIMDVDSFFFLKKKKFTLGILIRLFIKVASLCLPAFAAKWI